MAAVAQSNLHSGNWQSSARSVILPVVALSVIRDSSLCPNAPEVLEGSDEDVAIGDRQGGVGGLSTTEFVDGQQLEFGTGCEDHGITGAHQNVKASVGMDHRTPGQGRAEPFFVLPAVL